MEFNRLSLSVRGWAKTAQERMSKVVGILQGVVRYYQIVNFISFSSSVVILAFKVMLAR